MKDGPSEIRQAEDALLEAEKTYGVDHIVIATRLEELAKVLRTNKTRLLDAANMEARANVLREKKSSEPLVEDPEKIEENEERMPCPFCAELIKRNAKLCRFCRSELSAPSVTSVKKAPVAVPSRKVILLLVLSVVVLCAGYLVRQGSFGIIPFSMADLSRKKFVSEMEPSAYIQFRDDQNVDIQTEYSRYSGMELGILTGRYTIKQDSHKPEVRIEYMFNGANQVATYAFRITDGGVMYLTGETVEPLPRWLKYNPH